MKKFELNPGLNHKAIQWLSSGVLTFGEGELSLSFADPRVDIAFGVENTSYKIPNTTSPSQGFTGASSFDPDDVEVLVPGG